MGRGCGEDQRQGWYHWHLRKEEEGIVVGDKWDGSGATLRGVLGQLLQGLLQKKYCKGEQTFFTQFIFF